MSHRPKLVLFPNRKEQAARAGLSEDDFAIYATYQINAAGSCLGMLKVVRKTDGRLLYPFDGAAPIGPFSSKSEAITAAEERGREIVASDLRNPEL